MRVLSSILIGLGVLFLAFIALIIFFGWVGWQARSQFGKEQSSFAETFVTDLSKRWDIRDVYGRLADPFIAQAVTPRTQELMLQFKQLGALKSAHDPQLKSYIVNVNGTTGVITFRGTFENGEALVTVTVVKKDGAVHVWNLGVKALLKRPGIPAGSIHGTVTTAQEGSVKLLRSHSIGGLTGSTLPRSVSA